MIDISKLTDQQIDFIKIKAENGHCHGIDCTKCILYEVLGYCTDIAKEILKEIENNKSDYDRTIKHDQDKPRWDLLPYNAIEQIAIIMTQGAEKYGDYNWQKVEKERYQAAMMRHFCEYMNGNSLDKDSGMMHISHVLVNALFLVWKELENEKNT